MAALATLDDLMWVDAHCHIQLADQDPGALLDRAGHVDWVVVPGVDASSSKAAAELAMKYPGRVRATAGLHPHYAERWPSESQDLRQLAGEAVAVGETGLDYYRDLAPRSTQREVFAHHLDLALELGKPVVVHCRDAFEDVFGLLESKAIGSMVVMHCWTGGRRWTRRFLDLDVVFSFAGPIAFETGQTVRMAAALVPPDRALVETDTPYLSPPPHRGRPNEPAHVALVGAALADVWGVPVEEVAAITSANARRVFEQ